MTQQAKMHSRRARELFKGLKHVTFDHPKREDPQQVFMEQLELVATGLGLKPAFLAGQSSYSPTFLFELEAYARANGLLARRTENIIVQSELVALGNHAIPESFLRGLIEQSRQDAEGGQEILWIYREPTTDDGISACLRGQAMLGDVLGYPRCCTTEYLNLEAQIVTAVHSSLFEDHGAATEADALDLYRKEPPPGPRYAAQISQVAQVVQTQQAHTIRAFPFVHFIACKCCLDTPKSPASETNRLMEELAYSLDTQFARAFKSYATAYLESFENQ